MPHPHRTPFLISLAVTAFVTPLGMFIAHGPTGDDAAGGFRQAALTSADLVWCLAGAATIFCLSFVAASLALPRRAGQREKN